MYKDRSDVVVTASATTISKWLDMKEELSKRIGKKSIGVTVPPNAKKIGKTAMNE